jgi:hypothetical protein
LPFANPMAGTLDVDQWPALRRDQLKPMVPLRTRSAVAMRLRSYRDESHSRHFDLIGGGGHPWSIDLVSVIASGILVVGFARALIAHWVH